MSHISTMKFKIDNRVALINACKELNYNLVENSVAKLYGTNTVQGTIIDIPGWKYKVCITEDGEIKYDDYLSASVAKTNLNKLVQQYNYELTVDALIQEGYMFTETVEGEDIILVAYN